MVFLNEVLTEFLDVVPLTAIQRLWFQHERERWGYGAFLCLCTYVIGWISHTSAVGSRSCSMASTFARPYTVGIFLMGPSQGTGVSRRTDNTNRLSCLVMLLVLRWIPRCCDM
ncbi:DUF4817 domain-containing protein [Trichonephila clavipes]|nr:DUF4817 domain-containing protein [Trichonephila clavipes]